MQPSITIQEEIEAKLEWSLKQLTENDAHLLTGTANERSITYKLAEYLQLCFRSMNVDCEYSGGGIDRTTLRLLTQGQDQVTISDLEARTAYPDIVVHLRGMRDQNLLIIEAKKWENLDGVDFDKKKLMLYKEQLNFQYAVFIWLRATEAPMQYVEFIH
ncbi:hypothetical protein [Fibrella arboris]|uniref:hypothetical protein n=1 Tax=Fibrella arboris TaxID=3242486 RepID=UPI003522CA4C